MGAKNKEKIESFLKYGSYEINPLNLTEYRI